MGTAARPGDLKGSGALNFRYVSPEVPDDSYLYLPELRKVRRLSMANRSDAFWGTDLDTDSVWTWNSKLSFWTFKYLGTRKQLSPFHSGGYAQREAWCAPPDGVSGIKSFFCCLNHELRDTVIVEGTPSGFSQYAFSKRILYIDRESLMADFNEGYDQGGQLWKTYYLYGDAAKSPRDIERQPDGSIKLVPTKTVIRRRMRKSASAPRTAAWSTSSSITPRSGTRRTPTSTPTPAWGTATWTSRATEEFPKLLDQLLDQERGLLAKRRRSTAGARRRRWPPPSRATAKIVPRSSAY